MELRRMVARRSTGSVYIEVLEVEVVKLGLMVIILAG